MGYLLPALPDAAVLVAEAETRLLALVVLRPHHVLRPLFPPVIIRRPGLRPRPHDFVFPDKDDCNFIPRDFYRTLLHWSVYPSNFLIALFNVLFSLTFYVAY